MKTSKLISLCNQKTGQQNLTVLSAGGGQHQSDHFLPIKTLQKVGQKSDWPEIRTRDLVQTLKWSNSETYLHNLITEPLKEATLPKKLSSSFRLQNDPFHLANQSQTATFLPMPPYERATLRLIKETNLKCEQDANSQIGLDWPTKSLNVSQQLQLQQQHLLLTEPLSKSVESASLVSGSSSQTPIAQFQIKTDPTTVSIPVQFQMQMLTEEDLDLHLDCADWSEHFCESHNSPLSAPSLGHSSNQETRTLQLEEPMQNEQPNCYCSTSESGPRIK